MLQRAQVLVSESPPRSILGAIIRRATHSIYTHAAIVTGTDEIVEAWVPKVRTYSLSRRIRELEEGGRQYIVLELPDLTEVERRRIAWKARQYVGRWYDVDDILEYLWHGRFRADRRSAIFCSRLVPAGYRVLGEERGELYPAELLARLSLLGHPRTENLRRGYPTPADLPLSRLQIVDAADLLELSGAM